MIIDALVGAVKFEYRPRPDQVTPITLYRHRVVRVYANGQEIGDLIEYPRRSAYVWRARRLDGAMTEFALPSRVQGAEWLWEARQR